MKKVTSKAAKAVAQVLINSSPELRSALKPWRKSELISRSSRFVDGLVQQAELLREQAERGFPREP